METALFLGCIDERNETHNFYINASYTVEDRWDQNHPIFPNEGFVECFCGKNHEIFKKEGIHGVSVSNLGFYNLVKFEFEKFLKKTSE